MLEERVLGSWVEYSSGAGAERAPVEHAVADLTLWCVDWDLSGCEDVGLDRPGISVEHISSVGWTDRVAESPAAVLVYVDRFNDGARPQVEQWMNVPVIVLTRAVDSDAAIWALRTGVRDIIVVPRDLPYLADALKRLADFLSVERRAVGSKTTRRSGSSNGIAVRTRSALREIESRFRERLSVPALAAKCNMTTITFMRTFKKENGSTVLAYLNHYRIATAKKRLGESTTSIKEIALSCGFDDISYFSRVFRKIEGVPPTVYRDRFQKLVFRR